MANYSGNLVRVWSNATETQNFAPNPQHAVTDSPDPYGAVHQVPADTGVEYSGSDFPVDMAVGGGSVLATPSRSHEGLAGRKMVYTDDQHRESLEDRHSEDGQRGYIRATYRTPDLQDAHSVYSDDFYHDNTWGEHVNNVGAPAILRELHSSYPQSNPEGVREGMVRRTGYEGERRLGRRQYRYEAQQLIERSTYQDNNVPAPANADSMAAGSVLDSWQPPGVHGGRFKVPAMFRTPPPVDAASLAIDTGTTDNTVIGGGF